MYSVVILEKNQEILQSIIRWRCISIENVFDLLDPKNKFENIRYKIYRLEKYGLLKSKLFMHSKKIVYPSKEFLDFLGLGSEIIVENVRHDSYVASICTSLLRYNFAKVIQLPHEYKTKSSWKFHALEPDAIMELVQDGEKFQIAIEVELWRKTKKRVYEKMIEYAKAVQFDYAFYFFADEVSFNAYSLRIKELLSDDKNSFVHELISSKIVLVLLNSNDNRVIDLGSSKVFHNSETKIFKNLLGF